MARYERLQVPDLGQYCLDPRSGSLVACHARSGHEFYRGRVRPGAVTRPIAVDLFRAREPGSTLNFRQDIVAAPRDEIELKPG